MKVHLATKHMRMLGKPERTSKEQKDAQTFTTHAISSSVEADDVCDVHGLELEDDGRHSRAQDLGYGVVGEGALPVRFPASFVFLFTRQLAS